jgi:hypothetical protein
MGKNLVRHHLNPNNCVCGWYRFTFASCDHLFYAKHDKKCGKALSRTGKAVFCRTPAPQNIIKKVKLRPEYLCPYNCVPGIQAPQTTVHEPTMLDPNVDFNTIDFNLDIQNVDLNWASLASMST